MLDLALIVPPQNRNWILDRVAKEIKKRVVGTSEIVYRLINLPQAKHYWLAHYSILPNILRFNRYIKPGKVTVFYTHTSSEIKHFVPYFNKAHAVITESFFYYDELLKAGVLEEKLHMVPEGSDPEIFKPHERKGGFVLISGSYRRRKNFEGLIDVIKSSNSKFILVTRGLEKFDRANELRSLPNLTIYEDLVYEDYPKIYGECGVYLSLAHVEGGGPNSLIESMHANLVPVVTDVGNAREYIVDGYNGFILPQGSTSDEINAYIDKAYILKTDVSSTVSSFTWENYANSVLQIITGDKVYEKDTSSQP